MSRLGEKAQKDIVKLFSRLEGKHNLWKLWSDCMVILACAISNAVDLDHREQREQIYTTIASAYTQKELETFAEIYASLVHAMEINSDQDLLGELYMTLGLGNDKNGQFFTPYDVCRAMSGITWGNVPELIEKKHWIAVNDPAVGAGALLIAFANECIRHDINYQHCVLFTAQELDFTTACMCYIQLSLMGCPGYVYVGNTLTDPCTSLDGRALIPKPSANLWFTPMYFHEIWHYRRVWTQMDMLFQTDRKPQTVEEPAQAELSNNPANIESMVGNIPSKDAEIALLADDTGQLMLF